MEYEEKRKESGSQDNSDFQPDGLGSLVSSTEELNAEYEAALEDNKGSFSSDGLSD